MSAKPPVNEQRNLKSELIEAYWRSPFLQLSVGATAALILAMAWLAIEEARCTGELVQLYRFRSAGYLASGAGFLVLLISAYAYGNKLTRNAHLILMAMMLVIAGGIYLSSLVVSPCMLDITQTFDNIGAPR